MQGPWDAPESYRNQFVDEDDPQPGHFAQAPHKLLADGYDPDELHSIVCAYAGQVALLDVCLDALLEAAREHPLTDELLILVTSSRGFPLGEHLCVGQPRTLLYRELLHVPLLIRHPAKLQATHRCSRLAQPRDVYATLAEWFGVVAMLPTDGVSPLSAPVSTAPNFAVAVDEDQWGLRTPAWFARFASLPDEPGAPSDGELYLKPDDMWEVNDVSDRCGEVFAELYALAHRLRREGPLSTIPLPEVLWLGTE
jgi:arylsulfatase A-like enzyme